MKKLSRILQGWGFVVGAILLASRVACAGEQKCGLLPPTAADMEWAKKNLIIAEKVRLNQLAMDRISAEGKPRPGTTHRKDAEVAPRGQEVVGRTAEQRDQRLEVQSTPSGSEMQIDGGEPELPSAADNSTDLATRKFFPPIGDQGSLNSCGAWASTYYAMTYMTARAKGWDASSGDKRYILSPKWTYNIGSGNNGGISALTAFRIMSDNGCATWSDWPYETTNLPVSYREICTNTAVWRDAIRLRAKDWYSLACVNTEAGLNDLKVLLADGYVLTFSTYVDSWQMTNTTDDAGTPLDDAFAGEVICREMTGIAGYHALTVVGYNDHIWCDINTNGVVDTGEKGALKVANSWGKSRWDQGFGWLCYDALRSNSAVSGWTSSPTRQQAMEGGNAYWPEARTNYVPRLVMECTVQHAAWNELRLRPGIGIPGTNQPSTTWVPFGFGCHQGAFGFDGKSYAGHPQDAPGATFALDFTDLYPTNTTETKRCFLGIGDNLATNPATLLALRLADSDANLLVTCPNGDATNGCVPQTVSNNFASFAQAWLDFPWQPPEIVTNGLPAGTERTAYTAMLQASNGIPPYAWRVSGGELPAGLALSSTGAIRGIPLQPCTQTVALTAQSSGGAASSRWFTIIVVANPDRPPVIGSCSPPAGLFAMGEGTNQTFTVLASDPEGSNLTYRWTWNSSETGSSTNTFTHATAWGNAGTNQLRCYVLDGMPASNVFAQWTVTVLSDNDGDGIPNAYENANGLNPWDPSNATNDADHDLLTNLGEFQTGSSLTNSDTDGDSLCDGWEVRYGFDALTPSGGLPDVDSVRYAGQWSNGMNCQSVRVRGNYAFLPNANGNTFYVVDVSVPTNPVQAGWCLTVEGANDIALAGDYAYLTGQETCLQVIDVKDPTKPKLVNNCGTNAWGRGVLLLGDHAYVARTQAEGLQVYDVSNPTNPVYVSGISNSGWAYGVHVTGNRAYMAAGLNGLLMYDVSDPAHPAAYLGTFSSMNRPALGACGVRVVGDYAYVADDDQGLQVINVSDPTRPVRVRRHDTAGHARRVQVVGGYAYVADYDKGLQVIDVRDPTHPAQVTNYDTIGYACDVEVVGNYACMADGTNGLQVIEIVKKDCDADGMLDSWETASFGTLTNAANGDADGDGVSNRGEYLAGLSPAGNDTDHDGLLDGAEVNTHRTDPRNRDTDGDGMPDGWEAEYALDPGENDALAHADDDGFNNVSEYVAGTNPRDGNSFLHINGLSRDGANAAVVISWLSATGRIYCVRSTSNLLQGASWVDEAGCTNMAGTGLTMCHTNTSVLPQQFYRIGVRLIP